MRRSMRTGLLMLLMTAGIGLALNLTATAQSSTTDFAGTSRLTQAASPSDCEADLRTALSRLDKTLDAYEKATAVIGAKDAQIGAMKALDELKNQWLAIKDQMIKAQAELITFY